MNETDVFTKIDIDLLEFSPYQPREKYDKTSLEELSQSIRKYGIINPILVRKIGEKYEIIAGERRVKAAILAELKEVPAIIKSVNDATAFELALIDNIHREGINPIEEALAYNEILKTKSLTEEELSTKLGKSRTAISNKLALLGLPESIKQALADWKIGEHHARSLLREPDDTRRVELLDKIIKEKLTVKELDNIINQKKEEKESDNMNNLNFFPNMEQSQPQAEAPATLNSMNTQAMPQAQTVVQNNVAAPVQPNPIPDFSVQTENKSAPQMPSGEQPIFGSPIQPTDFTANNIPVEQPIETPPSNNLETPAIEGFNQTDLAPEPVPMPTIEEPIVNITPNAPSTPVASEQISNSNEPLYDIPITASSEPAQDITKIKEILNNNGIAYKSYSNETGHCIIIEI